jgi:hypothetical protein
VRFAETSSAAARGVVEFGVQTAYTVIDEYMRRGREAADRHREGPNWRGDMNDNRYNYGNPGMAYGPMWPLIAPWMQMMQAWTCAMGAFVPGAAAPQPWNAYATREREGCAPAVSAVPKVSVRVRSQYQTEVYACIDAGADAVPLTADPLETVDVQEYPPLRSVTIKCDAGHVHVQVTVPTDQPAGRYIGAIRDAAGCKRGELTLEIWNPPAPPARPRPRREPKRR